MAALHREARRPRDPLADDGFEVSHVPDDGAESNGSPSTVNSRCGPSGIGCPTGCAPRCSCGCCPCYLSWYLKQALAPILCHDHDEPAAAAQRRNPVRCGPAFQPRAGQGLPPTHRRPLPRHSFISLLADLATICANHVQPAHDVPAFTMITSPTPLQRWAFELLGVSRRHGLA